MRFASFAATENTKDGVAMGLRGGVRRIPAMGDSWLARDPSGRSDELSSIKEA